MRSRYWTYFSFFLIFKYSLSPHISIRFPYGTIVLIPEFNSLFFDFKIFKNGKVLPVAAFIFLYIWWFFILLLFFLYYGYSNILINLKKNIKMKILILKFIYAKKISLKIQSRSAHICCTLWIVCGRVIFSL